MSYYEILMEYYQTEKIQDFVRYFDQWKDEGLLSQEEIEKLNPLIPDAIDQIMLTIDQMNPEFVLRLYRVAKKERNWGDDELYENTGINKKDIDKIKKLQEVPKNIGIKLFKESFIYLLEKDNE